MSRDEPYLLGRKRIYDLYFSLTTTCTYFFDHFDIISLVILGMDICIIL
jgi:hypothetical protein